MWKAACEIRETNNEEVTWSSWRWSMMAVGWLEMAKSIVVANKTCTWHAMLQHVHALTRLVNTSHDGRTVVDQSAAEVHAPWTKLKFTSSQAKHAVWSVTKWSIVKDTSASFLVEQSASSLWYLWGTSEYSAETERETRVHDHNTVVAVPLSSLAADRIGWRPRSPTRYATIAAVSSLHS